MTSICWDIRKELAFLKKFNSFVEEDFVDHELKKLMVHMKQYILEVLLPFLSLHAFNRK
jgi:hypothetical protein